MIRYSLDAALAITDFICNPDREAELGIDATYAPQTGWCLVFRLPEGDARLTLDEADLLGKSLAQMNAVEFKTRDAREFFDGVAEVGMVLQDIVGQARAEARVH